MSASVRSPALAAQRIGDYATPLVLLAGTTPGGCVNSVGSSGFVGVRRHGESGCRTVDVFACVANRFPTSRLGYVTHGAAVMRLSADFGRPILNLRASDEDCQAIAI